MSFEEKLRVAGRETEKERLERKHQEMLARREEYEAEEKKVIEAFVQRCDEALKPLLEAVQRDFIGDKPSKLTSYYNLNLSTYCILLEWNDEENVIQKDPINLDNYNKNLCCEVIRRSDYGPKVMEGEFLLVMKNYLSTTNAPGWHETRDRWETKVTLNDPDWREKVEAAILKQLGIE